MATEGHTKLIVVETMVALESGGIEEGLGSERMTGGGEMDSFFGWGEALEAVND
jgi:hypothetical protein